MGIPQGSVLSALLCSFFYGDLEKRFSKFSEDPQSVCQVIDNPVVSVLWLANTAQELFRLIDDYLFITTSLPKARDFLDMMNRGMNNSVSCFSNLRWRCTWIKGHPEYGCFISKDKTLTNFDYNAEIMNVTEPQQQRQCVGFSYLVLSYNVYRDRFSVVWFFDQHG